MTTLSLPKAAASTSTRSFAGATPWDERKEGRSLPFTANTGKQGHGRASQLHPLPADAVWTPGAGGHVAAPRNLGNAMRLLVSQVPGGQASPGRTQMSDFSPRDLPGRLAPPVSRG